MTTHPTPGAPAPANTNTKQAAIIDAAIRAYKTGLTYEVYSRDGKRFYVRGAGATRQQNTPSVLIRGTFIPVPGACVGGAK